MPEVKDSEAQKPEYVYRPSIYFHAKDDDEAKSRASRIRAMIEEAIAEDNDGQLPRLSGFTYEQAWNEDDALAQRLHYTPAVGESDRRVVT